MLISCMQPVETGSLWHLVPFSPIKLSLLLASPIDAQFFVANSCPHAAAASGVNKRYNPLKLLLQPWDHEVVQASLLRQVVCGFCSRFPLSSCLCCLLHPFDAQIL